MSNVKLEKNNQFSGTLERKRNRQLTKPIFQREQKIWFGNETTQIPSRNIAPFSSLPTVHYTIEKWMVGGWNEVSKNTHIATYVSHILALFLRLLLFFPYSWKSGARPPNLKTANVSDYTIFCSLWTNFREQVYPNMLRYEIQPMYFLKFLNMARELG